MICLRGRARQDGGSGRVARMALPQSICLRERARQDGGSGRVARRALPQSYGMNEVGRVSGVHVAPPKPKTTTCHTHTHNTSWYDKLSEVPMMTKTG